jgi:hypothetical protein
MNVEISFTVQRGEVPSHHTDLRLSKVFDVEWPGRPAAGESIEVDVGAPGDENEFTVGGVYWATESPTLVYLNPTRIPMDEQEQLEDYLKYVEKRGWKITGVRRPAAT